MNKLFREALRTHDMDAVRQLAPYMEWDKHYLQQDLRMRNIRDYGFLFELFPYQQPHLYNKTFSEQAFLEMVTNGYNPGKDHHLSRDFVPVSFEDFGEDGEHVLIDFVQLLKKNPHHVAEVVYQVQQHTYTYYNNCLEHFVDEKMVNMEIDGNHILTRSWKGFWADSNYRLEESWITKEQVLFSQKMIDCGVDLTVYGDELLQILQEVADEANNQVGFHHLIFNHLDEVKNLLLRMDIRQELDIPSDAKPIARKM